MIIIDASRGSVLFDIIATSQLDKLQKKSGDHLGPYEIQAVLGSGGMGEVYLAQDQRLNRRVVVKIVNARLAADPNGAARLRREARAIASLDHPNICTLFEIGEDAGAEYLVMQYLEGETLADLLSRGPVPLERALQIAIDVASALAFAHRRGVLHRDIKPQNVMVLTDGRAKLLDFGLARTISVDTQAATEAALTRSDSVLGTLEYMAPEQLAGRHTDPRSDVFSLALVVYELVAGHHPFRSESAAVTVSGILTRDYPPIAAKQGRGSAALDGVLAKALSRDPGTRHANAAELLADLERIQRALPDIASRVPSRRGLKLRTLVVTIAAVSAVALLLAAYVVFGVSRIRREAEDIFSRTRAGAEASRSTRELAPLTVEYWFDVRQGRDDRNISFQRSFGAEAFSSGSKFRITMSSTVPAVVYLLNDDDRDLSLAYPLATAGSAGVAVSAARHETDWFGFSGNDRIESLWLVWSVDRIASLDTLVPSANERDLGIVRDPQTAASIRQWLVLTESRDVVEHRLSDPPRVTLSFAKSPLVRKITLHHGERSRQ